MIMIRRNPRGGVDMVETRSRGDEQAARADNFVPVAELFRALYNVELLSRQLQGETDRVVLGAVHDAEIEELKHQLGRKQRELCEANKMIERQRNKTDEDTIALLRSLLDGKTRDFIGTYSQLTNAKAEMHRLNQIIEEKETEHHYAMSYAQVEIDNLRATVARMQEYILGGNDDTVA